MTRAVLAEIKPGANTSSRPSANLISDLLT